MTHFDTPLLADSVEKETSHPELVTQTLALAWPDLKLPLTRHDFGVDPRDLHSGVEACSLRSHQKCHLAT